MAATTPQAEPLMQDAPRLGILLFIVSESIFFALLVAAYVFYTGASPTGPNAHQVLDPLKTGFFTACLLSSSITVWFSERARHKGSRGGVSIWLGVTMFLGLTFLYGEMQEYRKLLHESVTVSRDLFGSTFYTLTGFHALHVTVGLILLGTALSFSLRNHMGAKQRKAMTCITYYWHFVDGVWVVVFSTVYLWSAHL